MGRFSRSRRKARTKTKRAKDALYGPSAEERARLQREQAEVDAVSDYLPELLDYLRSEDEQHGFASNFLAGKDLQHVDEHFRDGLRLAAAINGGLIDSAPLFAESHRNTLSPGALNLLQRLEETSELMPLHRCPDCAEDGEASIATQGPSLTGLLGWLNLNGECIHPLPKRAHTICAVVAAEVGSVVIALFEPDDRGPSILQPVFERYLDRFSEDVGYDVTPELFEQAVRSLSEEVIDWVVEAWTRGPGRPAPSGAEPATIPRINLPTIDLEDEAHYEMAVIASNAVGDVFEEVYGMAPETALLTALSTEAREAIVNVLEELRAGMVKQSPELEPVMHVDILLDELGFDSRGDVKRFNLSELLTQPVRHLLLDTEHAVYDHVAPDDPISAITPEILDRLPEEAATHVRIALDNVQLEGRAYCWFMYGNTNLDVIDGFSRAEIRDFYTDVLAPLLCYYSDKFREYPLLGLKPDLVDTLSRVSTGLEKSVETLSIEDLPPWGQEFYDLRGVGAGTLRNLVKALLAVAPGWRSSLAAVMDAAEETMARAGRG